MGYVGEIAGQIVTDMLDEWLSAKLSRRKDDGLLRALPPHVDLIDFTSNDYLGLARNSELREAILRKVSESPGKNGSTGSRLLSGNSPVAIALEQQLAGVFQSQAALFFNSGYIANLAVLSSLPQRGDTIIYDELSHASIKDGARLSLATKFSFRHNDLEDLAKKIARSSGKIFVVVESVYSMDGDECPLEELVKLSRSLGFSIILDEAHTTGVRGRAGAGMAVEKGVHNDVDIRIYTFGKAMGVCGACVAGSSTLIDYLINFARPFIYTTAPSSYQLISVGCAFDHLSSHPELQNALTRKIDLFRSAVQSPSDRTAQTAIQALIVPGNREARAASAFLREKGMDVRPILSPTVPAGKERLRICLHTYNLDEDIVSLATLLEEVEPKS